MPRRTIHRQKSTAKGVQAVEEGRSGVPVHYKGTRGLAIQKTKEAPVTFSTFGGPPVPA